MELTFLNIIPYFLGKIVCNKLKSDDSFWVHRMNGTPLRNYVICWQGGEETSEEMCLAFISYYPKTELSVCGTYYLLPGYIAAAEVFPKAYVFDPLLVKEPYSSSNFRNCDQSLCVLIQASGCRFNERTWTIGLGGTFWHQSIRSRWLGRRLRIEFGEANGSACLRPPFEQKMEYFSS